MAKRESGRLMLESEIPAFVDAVIEAGCDICAIGHDCYVLGDLEEMDAAADELERIHEKFGSCSCCDGRSARTPKAWGGGMAADRKQKNGPTETAAHEVWRSLTSRGEQLLQRYWEEKTAMCISYEHYAHFLIGWKIFIVQRSYANAAALPNHAGNGEAGPSREKVMQYLGTK